jgi:hypothetical protein
VIDIVSLFQQLKSVVDLKSTDEEVPSLVMQYLLSLKRRCQLTIGTPFAVESQSACSFSAAQMLPVPIAAFMPAIPLNIARALNVHSTQSEALLEGLSHTRWNARAFELKNFDLIPRSVVMSSPLLGSASSDPLQQYMRACSMVHVCCIFLSNCFVISCILFHSVDDVFNSSTLTFTCSCAPTSNRHLPFFTQIPSCALVIPWTMRGELSMRCCSASLDPSIPSHCFAQGGSSCTGFPTRCAFWFVSLESLTLVLVF